MTAELARRAADGDAGPEVIAWISESMRRHLAGDELEAAFRLDGASRLRQRNRALLAAAEALDDGSGPWATAGRLAAAIRRYEARVWPLLRRDPSMALPPIDAALRRAFDAGSRIPRTQRRLYDLLND
jgi:hypothetical protein